MKIRVMVPPAAMESLRRIYPHLKTFERMLPFIAAKAQYDEAAIRDLAELESITLAEATRRVVIKAHPSMADTWPERVLTPQTQAKLLQRTIAPATGRAYKGMQQAAELMRKLLDNPFDTKVRRAARAFVKRYNPDYVKTNQSEAQD